MCVLRGSYLPHPAPGALPGALLGALPTQRQVPAGLGRWRGSRRDRQDLEEMPKAALLGFFLWRHRPPNHPGAQSYPLGMEGSRVERILRLTPVCWN